MYNSKVKKISDHILISSAFSLLPLILIFIIYKSTPDVNIFNFIFEIFSGVPANLSKNNLMLSKTLDVYCKTAPAFGFITIYSLRKSLAITSRNNSFRQYILITTAFAIFYAITFWLFIMTSHELTTAGWVLRLMASNDYALLIYYVSSYAGMFYFTVIIFWMLYCIPNEYKKRL